VIAFDMFDMTGDRSGGGLGPIEARRLFVARFVAEADVDEVSTVQHLARGLRETAFVAVERGQAQDAGQPQAEAQKRQQRIGESRQSAPEPRAFRLGLWRGRRRRL
jgi:hypothetical protein